MENIIDFFSNLDGAKAIELLIAIGIVAVLNIFSPLLSYVIIKIFNFKKSGRKIKQNAFYLPLKAFFKWLGVYIALMYLRPILNYSDNIMNIITKAFKIIVIINTSIGLAKSITENSAFMKKLQENSEKEVDDTTLIFIARIIRGIIYVIAGFLVFKELGYDLSGIITGLGLGSVVVTIAAQDTIKNLFGGIIIFFDKPFKVGDYIKFDEYEGTVEDLTFRSTKLRTIENSIAQIPNSEISSSTVINYSKMQKRRFSLDLGIVLNTNLEKMASLEEQILNYLNSCETVLPNSANVFFKEVRTSDFCLTIYCYLNILEYVKFMKEKEKLNYGIMNIIRQNNIELAYDTQTIEIKKA